MNFSSLLQQSELIDYKNFTSPEALQQFEKDLETALQNSEAIFENIITTNLNNVTFENTVEALLTSDRDLHILFTFLHNYNSTDSSETTRKIIENFQPKYVAYSNKVSLSTELYERLKAINPNNLNKEQQRSLELLIQGMEHAGVHLPKDKKAKLESISQQLSELSEKFSNNVLDDKKQFFYHFETDKDLKEVPEQELTEAKQEAAKRKLKGWVFTLQMPSLQAIMKYCSNSKIREQFFRANAKVASDGKYDNRPLVLKTLELRKEKAELLVKSNYAEYVLEQRMAENPKEVFNLIESVYTKAETKAQKDLQELEVFAEKKLEQWDTAYYSEKLKKEKYALDDQVIKQYFPLEQTIQGMFHIASRLYDIEFKKIDAPSYHKDVQNYEVRQGGQVIAYLILDLFARESKRGGAWCNDLRQRQNYGTNLEMPIVINVSNFGKAVDGKETLLTHYEVQTMFHEFGHGLHVMLGRNRLSNLSGFHTEWDFVELPSQLFENWCWDKEALQTFAKHYQTGEIIPDEIIVSLDKSKTFMSGLHVVRQNEFGLLDFILHTDAAPESVEALDAKCLKIAQKYSLLQKYEDYKMYASFSHIFAGGYAAGYYSYLWAELLEADVFSVFKKEGVLNKETGKRFLDTLLSQGTLKSGKELFHDFMRRDVHIDAYLKKYNI